jgi:holo-[acyl-carrier protein] synthase
LISNPETLLEDIFGLGVDIIEIKRFRNITIESNFVKNVFTPKEIDYCLEYPDPSPHLAATFAGKEAVLKAMSNVISLSMRSIEVQHDEHGLPSAIVRDLPEFRIFLSLAHSKEYAVAIALAIPSSPTASNLVFQKLLNDKILELLPRT